MLRKLAHRLSFANVAAAIALFVALGGTSVAGDATRTAVKLITGKQVRDGSLTTRDVKDRSLLARDFKIGQLPAGPQGTQGPQGPKGDKGDPGLGVGEGCPAGSTIRAINPDGTPLCHEDGAPAGSSAYIQNQSAADQPASLRLDGGIRSTKWQAFTAIAGSTLPAESGTFTTNGGRLLVTASATAYVTADQGPDLAAAAVELKRTSDNVVVKTDNMTLFFNQVGVHMALPTLTRVWTNVPAGTYKLSIRSFANSYALTTDYNDRVVATVHELPF